MSLLTEGLVRRGVDVTLFATADSVTAARLVATAPTGYSEDPGLAAKVWEALHISAVFERADEFDVIHNSFDFLPLTYSDLVDTPVVTTIHGFSSEQIVPVFEKYNAAGTTSRSATQTGTSASTTWRRSTTASTCTSSSAGRGRATTCCSSEGSIPRRAPLEAIDVAAEGRPAADHRGDHPGPRVLRAIRRTPARRRAGQLPRPRRSRSPRRAARRSAGPPPPRQLRRAVRLQRRRGDGVRNAGDHPPAGIDARDRPRWCERLPGRLSRRSGRRRARGRLDGQDARARLGRASLRRQPHG